MKVVILNWSSAENNPFEFASKNYSEMLRMGGREVVPLELNDKNFSEKMHAIRAQGVEFVMTYQGLRSHEFHEGKNIWEVMKLPLVCLHGDHPCHFPLHHKLDNRYCLHLYANAEWAQYANQHFHKRFAATVGQRALFSPEPRHQKSQGDHFTMAKNIMTPESFERHWKEDHPHQVSQVMLGAAAMLRDVLNTSDHYVRIHELMDAYIESEQPGFLNAKAAPDFFHSFHSQLDFYVRNYKSVRALEEMHDVPLKVYGRGWDELSGTRSSKHSFYPGQSTQDSLPLYNSRFGLIDISPAQGLHDRAKRAMSNQTAFATNAEMDYHYEPHRFPSIFFNQQAGSLREKTELIMADPERHQAACSEFSTLYQSLHKPQDFLIRIESFARALVSE
jgi:hypothetical protein